MVRKQRSCDPLVKRLFDNHQYCSKCRHLPKYFTGSVIQSFIGAGGCNNTAALDKEKEYRVCWDIAKKVDEHVRNRDSLPPPVSFKRLKVTVGNETFTERQMEVVSGETKKRVRRTNSELMHDNIREKNKKY